MTKKEKKNLPGWKEIPIGGINPEAGSALRYNTGTWRTFKPVWSKEKCIQCNMCWIHCPDSSILVKDGKVIGIDLEHCKGCGICAAICPSKASAVKMIKEEK
ncbi:MAG: 4Fe-4S binding protein [Candidatus Omnitrophota bacterium]